MNRGVSETMKGQYNTNDGSLETQKKDPIPRQLSIRS